MEAWGREWREWWYSQPAVLDSARFAWKSSGMRNPLKCMYKNVLC